MPVYQLKIKLSISKKTPWKKQVLPASSPTLPQAPRQNARDLKTPSATSGRAIPWSSGDWIGLGRSLKHLIDTITDLNNRHIGFKSLTENIDTTTSGGKLAFHIFGALAEFERDIIRERTTAGLTAARARGRKGGRPKALTPQKAQIARALYNDKNNTIEEICRTLNISRATLYRYINTGRNIA